MVTKGLLIPAAAYVPTLREQQAAAIAQQEAALAIEKALRAAGLPYEVWIIAAEAADNYEKEARALTKRMVAALEAHLVPALAETSTCKAA